MTRLTLTSAEQQRERNRQSKLRYQRALAEERKLEQSRGVMCDVAESEIAGLRQWLRGEGLTDFEVCCRLIGRVEVE